MNLHGHSDDVRIDLDEGLTTTPEDIEVLRALRAQVESWLSLQAEELDALLPHWALDLRPAAHAGRRPFTLE